MSHFQATTLEPTALDPAKRVNYVTGLVLGVDEMRQEQTYFLERGRLHHRGLHGYGTVNGLGVSVEPVTDVLGPEVRVMPGLAVDPAGRTVCVSQLQCARIDAWLETHREQVLERLDSPPGPLSLYVVLCYRECETDDVPVPGGPCRTGDDTMVASRLADSFLLEFRLDPPGPGSFPEDPWLDDPSRPRVRDRPPHLEEAAIRELGLLLGELEVTDAGGPYLTEAELLELVRSLPPVREAGAPEPGSPPASPPAGPYRVPTADAPRLLRSAFRVWITEKRPLLLGAEPCAAPPVEDDCLLLAELRFEVTDAAGQLGVRTDGLAPPVLVIEDERPLLYSTRLLQEVLLRSDGGLLAAPGSPPDGGTGEGGSAPEEAASGAAEEGIVVVALSWTHDQPSEAFVPLELGGEVFPALVVEFGGVGDVEVGPGGIDAHTFQVFLREPDERGFWYPRAVRPRHVLPVLPERDGDVITGAELAGSPAPAAAFVVDEETLEAIGNEQVDVVIRGLGAPRSGPGLHGPRFESWFVHIEARIDINTATAEELQILPRIGPVLAQEIVETRESIGGFTAVEDLLVVDGIGEYLLGVLRPFVTV